MGDRKSARSAGLDSARGEMVVKKGVWIWCATFGPLRLFADLSHEMARMTPRSDP